jgi:hypothetical protein
LDVAIDPLQPQSKPIIELDSWVPIRVVGLWLAVALLAACQDGVSEVEDPSDGGARFDVGVLDPPFEHVNATWAGVALLDFDGDGQLDIFLSNGRSHPDALYRNQGDGTFVDVAVSAGVASTAENGAVVAGDLDNDGDPDLVVAQICSSGTYDEFGDVLVDGGLQIYLNQGDGSFQPTDFALAADELFLLERCTISLGLADIDGDGFLDLITSEGTDLDVTPPWIFAKRHEQAENLVLLGDGAGSFDRALGNGGNIVSFVSAWFDLDGDGKNEVIWGEGGDALGAYQLEDGELVQRPDLISPALGLWMGLAIGDFDGDGDLDAYGTNQGLSPLIQGYDNLDDVFPGTVVAVADADGEIVLVRTAVNPFHAMHENRDGQLVARSDWPLEADHLLAGDLFEDVYGGYQSWEQPVALDRYAWGWGAVALDADADGWVDVAFTGNNGAAPMDIVGTEAQGAGPGGLLLNQQGAGFKDVTWDWGVANVDGDGFYQDGRGIATGDLNGDGFPDLVVANRTYNASESGPLGQHVGEPWVWLSQPRDGHWLRIDPVGTTSNRDAIGAEVRIWHSDREQVRAIGAGGQTCSWSEITALFGLGDDTLVDVEVRFPSGQRVTLTDVAADQILVVMEP